jgi:uncharacterized protein
VSTLSLIMKATRSCNLRCRYCFDWRSAPNQVMSFEVMLKATAAAANNARVRTVTFNWHGGEPTLLPMSFYERALSVQSRFRRPGQRFVNTIQTNATLLNRDWVSFLRANDFAIGVSVDGPRDIHDRWRVDRAGRGTFDRVCDGIAELRRQRAPFAVIIVVDRPTIAAGPDALLDFLVDQEITNVAMNFVMPAPTEPPPADDDTDDRHYVDPAAMSRFLIALWDARETRGLGDLRIRELDAIETSLAGGRPTPCTFAGACLGLVFRVEYDGDVYHCDYFGLDPEYRWGNVLSADFDDMRETPAMAAVKARERSHRDGLRRCPHYAVCNGWCPHGRRTARVHFPEASDDCCGLDEFVDHVTNRRPSARRRTVRPNSALDGLLELA